jgi:y4mF family transcriptional regulator
MLRKFVKGKRQSAKLTQPQLAEKAGVGLRFVRELEQGKTTLRMDKVDQVLKLFGYELAPVEMNRNYLLKTEPGPITLAAEKPVSKINKNKNEEGRNKSK